MVNAKTILWTAVGCLGVLSGVQAATALTTPAGTSSSSITSGAEVRTVSDGGTKALASESVHAAEATGVSEDLKRRFGVFRRAPTGRDTSAAPRQLADRTLGTNPALARQTGTDRVFAVPGTRDLCVADIDSARTASQSCASLDQAMTQGVFVQIVCDPDDRSTIRVSGLAPDGIKSVSLARADDVVATTSVNDNGYTITSDAGADEVQYSDGSVYPLIPAPC